MIPTHSAQYSCVGKFAKTLQKGQLITLEGTLRYREVEEDVEGAKFKHRIAEVHATGMKRLSKIETADDPWMRREHRLIHLSLVHL